MAQVYNMNSYSSYDDKYLDELANYKRNGEVLVERSLSSAQKREKATVSKKKTKKEEILQKLIALGVSAAILGGIATGTVINAIDTISENAIVYSAEKDFSRNVIQPNTHRTDDLQNYFYDYEDIAKSITGEGKDFSSELYLTYSDIGEYQTNLVLEKTGYNGSLEEYATAAGYESIEDWSKAERGKIILSAEVDEKKAELADMYTDYVQSEEKPVVNNDYVGGK